MISLEQVKNFWEESPLWSGESKFTTGTKEFFEEHRQTYINDCFAGSFDLRFYTHPLSSRASFENTRSWLWYWFLGNRIRYARFRQSYRG